MNGVFWQESDPAADPGVELPGLPGTADSVEKLCHRESTVHESAKLLDFTKHVRFREALTHNFHMKNAALAAVKSFSTE